MVIIVFSEPAYRYWVSQKPLDVRQDSIKRDSLLSTLKWEKNDSSVNKNTERILFQQSYGACKFETKKKERKGKKETVKRKKEI